MKQYDVKYDVGDEVFIIAKKEIFKSQIQEIRILEQPPYSRIVGNEIIPCDGISIDYLVLHDERTIPESTSTVRGFEWYSENDLFSSKDELIKKIGEL